MANAHSSTQSRKELLKHSLVFTIQHPLFGVGPGMFEVADDIVCIFVYCFLPKGLFSLSAGMRGFFRDQALRLIGRGEARKL